MIVLIIIALAIIALVVVGLLCPPPAQNARTEADDIARLHRNVRGVDQQIHAEYQAARRAMNDAAGQSWRNLVD